VIAPGFTIISARKRPEEVTTLCRAAISDPKNRARANFSLDYYDKPHTLLWNFYNGTFKSCGIGQGDYLLMFTADDRLMGGAGFYTYDDQYIMCMSRFYVMPGFENQWIGQYLLQRMVDRSQGQKRKLLITFNKYNKRIYDFYTDKVELLPPIWAHFKPMGQRTINHTEQYCCELDLKDLP
jgi:GNAT superfamily N-acetyltransferase